MRTPWNTLFHAPFFLFLSFLLSFLNYAVFVVSSALYLTIYLIRIMSDIVIVSWLSCVKTKLKTMGLICYTWKKLGSALCGNPTCLKFGRDTQYSRWLRGRILGQRGAGFNKDIPLETQSNGAFTLCQLYFLWEATTLQRSDQCFSSTGAILYVVAVNYIQYERADGPQTI